MLPKPPDDSKRVWWIEIAKAWSLSDTCRYDTRGSENTEDSRLRSHRHAGGPLQFAPADPNAFDGAQDGFPDAVAEHGTIDQAHRQDAPGAQDWFPFQNAGQRGEEHVHSQEYNNEWKHRAPYTEW